MQRVSPHNRIISMNATLLTPGGKTGSRQYDILFIIKDRRVFAKYIIAVTIILTINIITV